MITDIGSLPYSMPLGYPAAFSGMGPADITFSITSRPAVSIGDVTVSPATRSVSTASRRTTSV